MFGGYRFFLAMLVALSHFGFQTAGFNPGQWSVISFYVLSDLLMERQFRKLSPRGDQIGVFYLDRFLRIYPLYLAVLLLAWTQNHLSWREALGNLALLPLNYDEFHHFPALIPVSWSLACELHFYLLVPLLTQCSTKTLRLAAGASLGLFAVSPFLPHSTFWAYVGLPGILFTFVSGILINRKDAVSLKIFWLVMLGLLAGFAAAKIGRAALPTGIHINAAIGYLVAIAVVARLDRFSADKRWDKFLGFFAFPLFLCHGPLAEFLGAHGINLPPVILLLVSILFAAGLILVVELPFDRLRYRLRALLKGRP